MSESSIKKSIKNYDASNITVLEGLEPVRLRPGMYIGGTDENALHHLPIEVLDNSTDEAVAGYASVVSINLAENNVITISDNGRGIPFEAHPKYPGKTALEVILTTLHSGGKFNNDSYQTAGGLHGVGISVVNALSEQFEVEVIRNKKQIIQRYSKGFKEFEDVNNVKTNKSGTRISFKPDKEIFGKDKSFNAKRLYELVKSKAYLFKNIEFRWSCDKNLAINIPEEEKIKFPGGIKDFVEQKIQQQPLVGNKIFADEKKFKDNKQIDCKIGWAFGWLVEENDNNILRSYCNTIHTPQGGVHEQAFKQGLVKALKSYAELVNNKRASSIIADDLETGIVAVISVFISNPQFMGQTKEKLLNNELSKPLENLIKNYFENYFATDKQLSEQLIEYLASIAEERINRRKNKEVSRKTATQKLRLPGKLADCTSKDRHDSEIFIVEGDSAGGSAKQARIRETQAILPLRGKIINVASNTREKILANNEINDLITALGCGIGKNFDYNKLRYQRIIIMTDADVDGAHISSLLMTFFYKEMKDIIAKGHLYLAKPPLYRLVHKNKTYYIDDEQELGKVKIKLRNNFTINRFKGLGEMTAAQLKETTMNKQTRKLIKVAIDNENLAEQRVDDLMGRKAEKRFSFIQQNSELFTNLNELLDI